MAKMMSSFNKKDIALLFEETKVDNLCQHIKNTLLISVSYSSDTKLAITPPDHPSNQAGQV